jgi:glycosyltransferase involved in cell wall biosynthesis
MTPLFGVAITTLNRRQLFDQTMRAYRRHTPPDIPILVVDDGSEQPAPGAQHRNPTPQGIAAAKNASIALLMDAGVEHLFLSDDDVHPNAPDWWRPYTESRHPHLLHQPNTMQMCPICRTQRWHIYNTIEGRFDCTHCVADVAPLYQDHEVFAPKWAAGVVYYLHRDVVERVGGLREQFGRWSAETWEYSYRIHNALGTTYPFLALRDSRFHAVDAYATGKRSCVPPEIRNAHRERNWRLFLEYRDSTDFVPYQREHPAATVCVPWRPTPERIGAHDRCMKYWTGHGYPVIEADSDTDLPFLCGQARNNAARQADTDLVIIADADTVPERIEQIHAALAIVSDGGADLVYPYTEFLHIPGEAATDDDYTTARVQQRYHDSPGGIFVMRRETLWGFGGFDELFTPGAMSFDDTSFRHVVETLGTVQRIPGTVYSFNHATNAGGQPDRDYTDNNPNKARFALYEFARGRPRIMRELIKR